MSMKSPSRLDSEEERAIRALKRVAARWPKSLWLFSGSGSLNVMKAGPDGRRMYNSAGVDQAYIVDTVRIPNDGGVL